MKHFNIKFTIILLALAMVPVTVYAANISKSYNTDTELAQGVVVSLVPNRSNTVEPATVNSLQYLVGVVSADNNNILTITDEQANSEVQVANEGETPTLVSNLGGTIEPGDYITASPVEGVAMKANDESIVLGVATTSFNPSQDSTIRNITSELPSDITDGKNEVYLGSVRVAINISDNPDDRKAGGLSGLIQDLSKPLLDRGVSMTRMILAFGVFLATIGLSGWMLIAGVRSSIVSLGRNPLSRPSINEGLLRVVLIACLLVVSGFVVIFLLL